MTRSYYRSVYDAIDPRRARCFGGDFFALSAAGKRDNLSSVTVVKKCLCAGSFFEDFAKASYTEKIVGRLNGSMGFVFDEIAKRYVPNTVLHEDMRDMVSPLYRIVATYRKNIKDIQYSEVVYAAKKVDFNSLIFPTEIADLQRLI